MTQAQQVIKENFKEASILFGVDQLVKGVLGAINRLLLALTSWLPIPVCTTSWLSLPAWLRCP